ncbi:MAG: HlyC/CorC family transporter [Anaerofustis stercorihominis]|nr:HlyC/CorC family transporter [Anaerofustis stercorihominis]
MDGDSWILILIALFFLAGCYFASAESAYAGLNKIRIKNSAENGDKRARRAQYISNHFDKMLTTVLIGNNISHVGCSALVTLYVTKNFGANWVSLSTIITTVVVFMFCEMIPKSFAKSNSEKVALAYSSSLRFLMKIFTPVAFLFTGISNIVYKMVGSNSEPTITEDEFYEIIDNIEDEGIFEQDTQELVQSALEFSDIAAQEVLTPRVDIIGIDVNSTDEEIMQTINEYKCSRFPIYDGTIDNIVGILHVRKYLKLGLLGTKPKLTEVMSEPYFVHKTTMIDDLLEEMSRKKIHMAIITDEFGGTMGLITIEDILEELVGEIWDESDEVIEEFQKIGGGRYRISGEVSVGDAFEMMGLEFEDEEFRHRNISGWAMSLFPRIPDEGDSVEYENNIVEVAEVNNNRIISIVFSPKYDEPTEESSEVSE